MWHWTISYLSVSHFNMFYSHNKRFRFLCVYTTKLSMWWHWLNLCLYSLYCTLCTVLSVVAGDVALTVVAVEVPEYRSITSIFYSQKIICEFKLEWLNYILRFFKWKIKAKYRSFLRHLKKRWKKYWKADGSKFFINVRY